MEDGPHDFLHMIQLLVTMQEEREVVFTFAGSQLPNLIKVSPSNCFTKYESNTCSGNKMSLVFQVQTK